MIDKKMIDLIADRINTNKKDLIEKDLILHHLLVELSSNKYFYENFAFKGGTCLIKCFIDYYRFSEDLDFTLINKEMFKDKSAKQIRKMISSDIDKLADLLKLTADKIGLDFKADKKDKRYFHFGGSNRFVTFKLWYLPEGAIEKTFLKVEINFLEKLEFLTKEKEINNLFFSQQISNNSAFFLPPNSEWALKIPALKCYDIREVLVEKARAILTRRGTKARDYIDIFMIEKAHNLKIEDFKKQIIDKVKAMLKFEKYKINLSSKEDFTIEKGAEDGIMLKPLPTDFSHFLDRLNMFLREVAKEIK